jgi:hypothetical protein
MMDLDAARTEYHRVRIGRAMESFDRKLFVTHSFETPADAGDFFFSQVSRDESIGYGGSDTVSQLGVRERLAQGDYNFLDRSKVGHAYDEQLDIRRRTLSADVFIASSNAVSIGGALVNIDGDGNRVAGISLGPRRVFLFIGRNKLCDDLKSAVYRAKNVAAPALAIQLGKETPCVKTGRCHDCASPDRICSNLSIIERCEPAGRISLLFINEDLGL